MKLIITYILLFVGCILLSFNFLYENVPSTESDILVRLYYIGGVVSGVFAFGAFFVAILTYYNQKKTGDLQRFETTLFNMLQLQQQITNELRYEDEEPDRNPNHGENTGWRTIKKVEGMFSNIFGLPNGSVLEKSPMVRFLLMKNLGMKE